MVFLLSSLLLQQPVLHKTERNFFKLGKARSLFYLKLSSVSHHTQGFTQSGHHCLSGTSYSLAFFPLSSLLISSTSGILMTNNPYNCSFSYCGCSFPRHLLSSFLQHILFQFSLKILKKKLLPDCHI